MFGKTSLISANFQIVMWGDVSRGSRFGLAPETATDYYTGGQTQHFLGTFFMCQGRINTPPFSPHFYKNPFAAHSLSF